MDPKFLVYFLIVESIGLFFNLLTLYHICATFEIKIHVFTMIFIDSVLTNVAGIISIILDTLLLVNVVERTRAYCTMVHAAVYLPFSCGALLTLQVALVRYILTRKSAR